MSFMLMWLKTISQTGFTPVRPVGKMLNKAKSHPRWGEAFIITLYPQTNYTSGADHFHADHIDPSWNKHMKVTAKIGRHIFYK